MVDTRDVRPIRLHGVMFRVPSLLPNRNDSNCPDFRLSYKRSYLPRETMSSPVKHCKYLVMTWRLRGDLWT